MASNFRRRAPLSQQAGTVLILATISVFTLLGFAGLAIDVGYLEHVKRRMQTAADAGALAGDFNLAYQGGGVCASDGATSYAALQTAALNDVQTNGFTNGSSNITVTVHCGSSISTGYHVGDTTAVEVIVQQSNQPGFFMKALGYAQGTVAARAVAAMAPGGPCILGLDTSATPAVWLQGNATLNANCGIFSDSRQDPCIRDNSGSFATNAQSIGCSGTPSDPTVANTDGGTITVGQNMLPVPDPFANLTPPISTVTPSSCNWTGDWTGTSGPNGNGDLGAEITAQSAAGNPPQPGIYVICGNLTGGILPQGYTYVVTGNAANGGVVPSSSLTMDTSGSGGVTFYLTCMNGCSGTNYGDFGLNGNVAIDLAAPTSGDYANVLVYGDPSATQDSSSTINGTSQEWISGAIYLPHTDLTLNGTSGYNWTIGDTAIVANTVKIAGNFTFTANANGTPATPGVPTLVE